jgi:hypothetical protein
VNITSPSDGAILPYGAIDFNVRIFSVGAGVASVVIEQSYAEGVGGGDHTYSASSVNSTVTDQTVTISNITTPALTEAFGGLLTFVAVATLQNGTTFRSAPITLCITSLNRAAASEFYDLGTYSGSGALCIPTILPDWADDNSQIVIDGVIMLNGNRCSPFETDRNTRLGTDGLLLSLYAQTYRNDLVSKVTAEINYLGDFPSDIFSEGEIELSSNFGTNIWTGYQGISYPSTDPADPQYYPLPDYFKRVEVTFRAYNLENLVASTDIASLNLPPCANGGNQTFPTATPTTQPIPPTVPQKPKEEQQEPPADSPTPCPPTVYCG